MNRPPFKGDGPPTGAFVLVAVPRVFLIALACAVVLDALAGALIAVALVLHLTGSHR